MITKKFKNIEDTYKLFSFFLIVSMMYPNPANDRKRAIGAGVLALLCIPELAMIVWDIYLRVQLRDFENLVRQVIMSFVFIFIIVKMIITLARSHKFRALFDKVNSDYESFNELPADYQEIVEETVCTSQFLERGWVVMLALAVGTFPALAWGLTARAQLSDYPRKFMIHETYVPFIDHLKYETPYYEILTVYILYLVWFTWAGYTGFDGIFYITVLHVELKIKLYTHKISHLMDEPSVPVIKAKIADIVKDQCEMYTFLEDVQSCYELWLTLIFLVSMVQTGMALTQTTSNSTGGNKVMYFMLAASVAVNIFLLCYVTSTVTSAAEKVCDSVYGCGWESIRDPGVRRSVAFMLARAQRPTHFVACNMLTFGMEMFMSIMQTAYSMYTLLRS